MSGVALVNHLGRPLESAPLVGKNRGLSPVLTLDERGAPGVDAAGLRELSLKHREHEQAHTARKSEDAGNLILNDIRPPRR